jgi:hypothetical protein
LQKSFAKDINGIVASELIMLYLVSSTSNIEAGTASIFVRDHDNEHRSENSDYHNVTIEITPDGDNANNTMLSKPGTLPVAAEELDLEAYPILSKLFPSDLEWLPTWQLSGLLRNIVNIDNNKKQDPC